MILQRTMLIIDKGVSARISVSKIIIIGYFSAKESARICPSCSLSIEYPILLINLDFTDAIFTKF